jgi:hypothetical protein
VIERVPKRLLALDGRLPNKVGSEPFETAGLTQVTGPEDDVVRMEGEIMVKSRPRGGGSRSSAVIVPAAGLMRKKRRGVSKRR